MATWTDIPDSSLEPGKPARSIDALALRDNPIAIAEGDPNAPKIVTAAMAPNSINADRLANGTITGDKFNASSIQSWLGARPLGSVGSTVLARCSPASYGPGATVSGSQLRAANALGESSGSPFSGTWRCMGYAPNTVPEAASTTLWLRIA